MSWSRDISASISFNIHAPWVRVMSKTKFKRKKPKKAYKSIPPKLGGL